MRSFLSTWIRRSVSISLVLLSFVILTAASPLWLPILAIAGMGPRRRWAALRVVALLWAFTALELVGVAASFAIWLCTGRCLGLNHKRFIEWNYRLQWWWGPALLRTTEWLYGLRFVIDGNYDFTAQPFILFVRHASIGDTVLPVRIISKPFHVPLRYVLKRELLWDPCLDIVGLRLPNRFVRRDGSDTAREIQAVASLAHGLARGEGVLIYPEATRFSEAKRLRIIEKARDSGNAKAHAEAESFRNVLPPRPGGPMALLAAAPEADALFFAHSGFDHSASFAQLFKGELIGRTIHVCYWHIPSESIPREADARREWLLDQWRRVDAFVGAHRDPA